MKTQGRTVTLCISLALASCALILTLRAFAQSSSSSSDFTITFKDAPLKDDYAEDASSPNGKFKKLLDAKGKSFDVVGKDKHDKPISHHKAKFDKGTNPTASRNNSSEIIRVVSAPTPATTGTPPMITGVNVTQNVTTASTADMTEVLKAFQ